MAQMTQPAIASAIRAVAPTVEADAWAAVLAAPMQSAGITTGKRIAMLVGQCACETGFRVSIEDLRYSSPTRLMQVFGSHFPAASSTAGYLNNPERLANYVYANRGGNGGIATGDGWRFRGRGLVQLTGRDNYAALAATLGKTADDIADWVGTNDGAAASVCHYWLTRTGLMQASDNWQVQIATRLINPGLNPVDADARTGVCNLALAALAEGHPTLPIVAPETTADLNAAELDKIQKGTP